MAKGSKKRTPRGGRAGSKKANRRLNNQDALDFLEQETREERQGLLVDRVPDADLFFVDKAGDEETAAAAKQGKLPRKLAARQKTLRSQAILQGAHAAIPVAAAVTHKPKGSVLQQQERAKRRQAGTAVVAAGSRPGRGLKAAGEPESLAFDAWEEPEQDGNGWTDGLLPAKRQRRTAVPASRRPLVLAAAVGRGPEAKRPTVPAVEIDPAGCSYNPDPELHQEAVATAVAAETRKLLDKELQPVPPPRTVDYQPESDELALLQTLEGGAEEEPEAYDGEEEEEEEEGDGGDLEAARRKQEAAKKTKKDRNRDKRRRDADDQVEQQRKLKSQRQQLSSLPQIEQELQEEEEEKKTARLRRKLDREERLAAEPPKLSKLKFQPMPLQVLTSDELAGSLRRLKPTTMLAKDRFKSLQKRALIEPRRKIEQKKQGKKVEYVQGERAERAAERQAELVEMRKAKKAAKKQQK